MTAFGQRYGQQCPPDLVEIGQGIVERCANVPLAIRVVGSLLYDQGREKWLWFQKAELGRLKDGGSNAIGPILKLSYYHLDPPLKTCFGHCALFCKDDVIEKETLIRLWMAQDYILPQEGQSVRTSSSKQNVVDQMEELKALSNLKGSLDIVIGENGQYAKENVEEGGYIRNKGHLNRVRIWFPTEMGADEQRLLLEDLQPHCNVRELRLVNYGGMRMPSWAKEDDLSTFLPNLVKLQLCRCPGWQHLPSLRNLHNLKSLEVRSLRDLEYIENTSRRGIIGNGVGASESRALFPFLQQLTLMYLDKLRGWWRDDDDVIDCDINQGQQHLLTSFPSLSLLTLSRCPNFTCVVTCPNVEELELEGKLGEKSRIMIPVESGNSKLRIVWSTHAGTLKSIWPTEAFQCVQEMRIDGDEEMESLSEVEEVFCSCSSLRHLYIISWKKLKTVGGGLEHLTALETLRLDSLPNLMNLSKAGEGEEEDEVDDEMPWRCLHQRLQSLTLRGLPKLVNLPKGMGCLRALQSLSIFECKALESLPESMRELTSLRSLTIKRCSDGLMERCRENTGKDWPNIQHIYDIRIIEDDDEW
ncbi:hypothetical protein Cgig2_007719 [Carnegiea gigantea]|uniref:NB-ARC domain-containing protein n=1 Tax=Carnegiea gigantea TaxID=171969 RepID=A0A9Q1K8K6_9CARY|nr:hypothetical protein Cgig2_007719 [Carnegiea gigantea]